MMVPQFDDDLSIDLPGVYRNLTSKKARRQREHAKKLIITTSVKYGGWLKKHLEREHPKTKGNIKIR